MVPLITLILLFYLLVNLSSLASADSFTPNIWGHMKNAFD